MRIDSRNQIQYGGPDTTETLNTKTPNETSVLGPLGIGGTKDSFETGKSITDGTKDSLRNPMLRLDYQEMMLQKDNDVDTKIAFADGNVLVSNDLQNDLQNTFKKEN